MAGLNELKERASTLFYERFGEEPALTSCAPGRVNLIGEHTDYNDGFVFPAAIDRHVVVAVGRSPDATKAWSEAFAEPAAFDTAVEAAVHGWARYPAGCAWMLVRDGYRPSNVNAVVVSDLPPGSGLSSSAAIEMAFLTAWNELDDLGLCPATMAKLGQRCEHEFVGVHCGLMDQFASALGREGSAMLLDTRSLKVDYVPIPTGLTIVVCDTNKPRALDDSAYNRRRKECATAAERMGVASLRDATLESLHGTFPQGSGVLYTRAKHVITENERCVRFAVALARDERAEIGRLMSESHASLRDDYEVSSAELDWMVESAGSAQGNVGVRMTGAGFGGACVALVDAVALDAFLGDTERAYRKKAHGLEPRFLMCQAMGGARTL